MLWFLKIIEQAFSTLTVGNSRYLFSPPNHITNGLLLTEDSVPRDVNGCETFGKGISGLPYEYLINDVVDSLPFFESTVPVKHRGLSSLL